MSCDLARVANAGTRGDAPKVGYLQSGRPRFCDFESVLEVLVERVQQAITEAPEEEKDGDQSNRIQRLSQCQLSCFGPPIISHPQGAPLPEFSRHVSGCVAASRAVSNPSELAVMINVPTSTYLDEGAAWEPPPPIPSQPRVDTVLLRANV